MRFIECPSRIEPEYFSLNEVSVAGITSLRPGEDTVITSTRRLARRLRRDHDEAQVASGRSAWASPDVIPWDAWSERCWRKLRDWSGSGRSPAAISDDQELVLWEEAASNDAELLEQLLMPGEIAREARRAWNLAADYQIPRQALIDHGGTETRQLLQMAARVEARLRAEGWSSRAQRLASLTGSPHLGRIAPKRVLLAGFDELTPAQDALISAFRSAGTAVVEYPPERLDGVAVKRSCADPAAELQEAALAARRWLEACPDASIGIVLADLEQRRQEVEEIFDDVLTPTRIVPGQLTERRAWDMSLGAPLSSWPVVDAALRALNLALRPATFADLGLFLRSPFIGGAQGEAGPRAVLDADLRAMGIQHIDLAGLVARIKSMSDSPSFSLQDLMRRLVRLQELARSLPEAATPERWAGLFGELLNVLGWPGDRPLDSAEYQCQMKWQQLLSTLAAVGTVTGRMSASACLDRLRRLAMEGVFQPEAAPAPVQIMGLLETPGLTFDALWVTGLHHQAWPRPLRPNTLIPTALQRHYRMPRAAPDLELAFAHRRTDALARSAREVVFSWPAQIDDESLRPSPLISRMTQEETPTATWDGLAAASVGHTALERLVDEHLRPLPAGTGVRGGSAVVKSQSACPFQAQARARLDACSLERPAPGVSAMDSGRIAHLALQWLWDQWRSSTTLGARSDVELAAEVDDAVRRACRKILDDGSPFSGTLIELEKARTVDRILALLAQDRAREPFIVEAVERECDLELEGVRFQLRIDRVDRLPGGALLLIDYKTGAVNVRDWHGERPRDPQLPFYALAEERQGDVVGGLAFGCLRVGEEGYTGYGAGEVRGTGIKDIDQVRHPPNGATDWRVARAEWRRHLERLVREFSSGDARVSPRRISEDCRYCDLSALCRRHELIAMGALSDD